MILVARSLASALLLFCVALGWQNLHAAPMGYISAAVPALLAAWLAAWFGDDVGDLIGLGPDALIRAFGITMLVVMSLVVAALRWRWLA